MAWKSSHPPVPMPAATQNLYDGMGRITDALSLTFGDEKWRTETVYAVTAPQSSRPSEAPFSRPERIEFGATLGKKAYRTQVYDEHTGRLTRQTTDRDLAPQRVDDTTYTYDQAGNVTELMTASGQDAEKSVDTQCFTNDPLGRLTEAWTAKTDCTTDPSASTVGGPDAYWHTYGYDETGNATKSRT